MKASPVLNLTLMTIAALCALQLHISAGQFYGGSISYTIYKNPDGKDVVINLSEKITVILPNVYDSYLVHLVS